MSASALPTNSSDSFGGFEYGYQQGVLGQSLVMTRFVDNFPSVVKSSSATGWLTSVLQLGGILGSLSAGVFGEVFSRKYTMFSACCWVVLGSYLYCGAGYHKPECSTPVASSLASAWALLAVLGQLKLAFTNEAVLNI